MVRRITPSQLRSQMRQAVNKYNQEIRKHNQAVNKYNRELKNAVNKINQDQNRIVQKNNKQIRAYNAAVRQNQQRINTALQRLNSAPSTTRYIALKTSTYSLNESFARLEKQQNSEAAAVNGRLMFDFPEQENANNLELMNALLGERSEGQADERELEETAIKEELRGISEDLDKRWAGAIFALNPLNPDAARHFCTSAREIFTSILEIKAPDSEVLEVMPNCQKTNQGKPTRRAKIHFALRRKGLSNDAFENFVDEDIDNIVQLFRVFNDATHGSAGSYESHQLIAIKQRVEGGILFLANVFG